jgi:flavin-dependent dehydrogenase
LDAEDYILNRFNSLLMDEIDVEIDALTFDKLILLKDLLGGKEVHYSVLNPQDYARIIDATEVKRAFLPKLEMDRIFSCHQYRISNTTRLPNRINIGKMGYSWCFPLSNDEYHMGCGSIIQDPVEQLERLEWIKRNITDGKIICQCSSAIRLNGPSISQPFTVDSKPMIWGIGEAIGCVAPLAGDGVVSGMKSVNILLDNWFDAKAYRKTILEEFKWMDNEGGVIEKLINKEGLGFHVALVLRRNAKRMGIKISLRDAATLLNRLR